MLKNIVISVFVGVILAVSVTASAKDNELTGDTKSSSSVENSTIKKEIPIQATSLSNDKVRSAESQVQVTDKSEPVLPTIWLLTLALFGFVMLSNRSDV
jgi:hypothetical protein